MHGGPCTMVLNHVVWMRHFRQQFYTIEYLLGFFLMVGRCMLNR
jgi:hypothetical protein